MQNLKGIFRFMVMEYRQILEGNKTSLARITIDSKKPEGYGSMPYYTPAEKETFVSKMQESFDKAVREMGQKLQELDAEEKKSGPLPVSKLSKIFMEDMLGKFNLLWKANAIHLSNIEKQVIRSQTLKECPSILGRLQARVQKGQSSISSRAKKILGRDEKTESPPNS